MTNKMTNTEKDMTNMNEMTNTEQEPAGLQDVTTECCGRVWKFFCNENDD